MNCKLYMKGTNGMKHNFRTILNTALCAVAITASVSTTAFAYAPTIPTDLESPATVMTLNEGGIVPYAEETTWYVRIYNGQPQKRLWSNTRGIWLTDWIDFGVKK